MSMSRQNNVLPPLSVAASVLLDTPPALAPEERESIEDERRPMSILMCAPTAYALKYEINPWMRIENTPDLDLAARQWNELYRVLTEEIGANVMLIEQAPDCPDMVFTANAGLVR